MSQTASQPIIIIGMHRSGTSLLARILRESGVHIGADCDAQHSESELMRSLNESVLDSVGASWYQPLAAETLIDQEVQAVIVNRMQSLCRSEGYRFTGNRQIALFGQSQTWGWKDPRTVLTLPIWLSVFPYAPGEVHVDVFCILRGFPEDRLWDVDGTRLSSGQRGLMSSGIRGRRLLRSVT